MGREQQASGAALERDLDAFHVNLSSRGWYVQRNHPKDRRTKGPPDYLAIGHGVSVLFDAKSCKADRWSLHLLKPHQAQALTAWERAGGRAGIYLRVALDRPLPGYSGGSVDVWVDWSNVEARWRTFYATGRADYLTRLDGEPVFGCDWTAAVLGRGLPGGTAMFPERGGVR